MIAESGRWAYVAFATKTRGWLPVEAIERVIPTTPPGTGNGRSEMTWQSASSRRR